MAYTEPIIGKYIDLRCAEIDDAQFTLDIRQDDEFVKYLPRIENTLEQQKTWLKKQRNTEGDYFFVVWDKQGNRLGTISVSEIFENNPKAGRLALKGNALQNLEAQYLIFAFAFDSLGVNSLCGFIYAENIRAIRFAQQFGVTLYEEKMDENHRLIRDVVFFKKDFKEKENFLKKMIYRK